MIKLALGTKLAPLSFQKVLHQMKWTMKELKLQDLIEALQNLQEPVKSCLQDNLVLLVSQGGIRYLQ